jgi:recombination protein RecA
LKRLPLENGGGGGAYFTTPKKHISFIHTGCKTLDLALGGGWAMGRIVNVVGDKATGKTLLAIEAAANFSRQYPKGHIRYRESEAAFDKPYADALGMPVDRVDFGQPLATVEDLFEDLEQCCQKAKQPELYILDSLDALSDRSEMDREIDQGSYGAGKAKKMSELFRRLVRVMNKSNLTLIIISQVRDKIGVTFGRKTTRTGGRALDFYASQILYIAQRGQIPKTVRGIKRTVGIEVSAKVDKNKIGLAYREAEFSILFGYGIDDEEACRRWLTEIKCKVPNKMSLSELRALVEDNWWELETSFLPTRKKYG